MVTRATPQDLRDLYRLLLGREPDAAGYQTWLARLDELSLDNLVFEFVYSDEFQARYLERSSHAMDFPKPPHPPPTLSWLECQLATQSQVDTMTYRRWCAEFRETPRYHRKQWEFVYVLQALHESGLLRAGIRGVGFGVGREPIPSVLAKYGCDVVVTDLEPTAAADRGWRGTNQHANSVDEVHRPDICSLDVFRRHVQFRVQDMNALSEDLKDGSFDFVWSLCALEHLGSLASGLTFIRSSLACLKAGAIAVHTTEYNVSSNDDTIGEGPTVLYRKRDVEALATDLQREGYAMRVNLHPGDGPLDRHYDVPPYRGRVHLKLQLDQYVATSLGLLISKRG